MKLKIQHCEEVEVPFDFCERCKKMNVYTSIYGSKKICLYDETCKNAIKVYKDYQKEAKEIDNSKMADKEQRKGLLFKLFRA